MHSAWATCSSLCAPSTPLTGPISSLALQSLLSAWSVLSHTRLCLTLASHTANQVLTTHTTAVLVVACCDQDMSYPAASLIVSNSLPESRQGVGASMINAVVNLSVSLGLGIAGTVQSRVIAHGDGSESNLLSAQRSAVWCGVGLAGFGVLVTVTFIRVRPKRERESDEKEEHSSEMEKCANHLSSPHQLSAVASSAPLGDGAASVRHSLEATEVGAEEAV